MLYVFLWLKAARIFLEGLRLDSFKWYKSTAE